MATKVLGKSMDQTTPDPKRFEVAVVELSKDGDLVQRKVEGDELAKILAQAIVEEKK